MEEEMRSHSTSSTKFQNFLVVITSIAALGSMSCFFVGYAFFQGILMGSGVLTGEDLGEELTILLGFIKLIDVFSATLDLFVNLDFKFDLFVNILIIVIVCFVVGLLLFNENVNVTLDKLPGRLKLYCNTLLVFGSAFLIISVSMNLGKITAKHNISDFLNHGCEPKDDGWNRCHQILLNNELIHEGFIILKSDQKIVMFKRLNHSIEYITLPQNAILTRKYTPVAE